MVDEPRATNGLCPGRPIRGCLVVPGSKSLGQRALVCASLCGGTTRIAGLPDGDDVRAALALIEACGARVDRIAPAAVNVTGSAPGPHGGWSPAAPLDAGESGTLARLATAALALCGRTGIAHEIRVHGSMHRRTSAALFAALRDAGVVLETDDGEALAVPLGWPVRLRPLGPPSRIDIQKPGSSQEVSALLIALAAWPDEIALFVHGAIPSRPYLDMTVQMLRRFGVVVGPLELSQGEVFSVRGPLRAPPAPILIEPDASSAAVALAAACLSDGEVLVPCLYPTSEQGDVRAIEHLAGFGCRTWSDREGLHAAGRPTRGVALDLAGEPDLAPVMAAVAAGVALRVQRGDLEGPSATCLSGLGTLPGKESSRIEVLAQGLRAIGLSVETTGEALSIAPGSRSAETARRTILLDPRGDHRMAFAFALLGLCVEGLRVRDPECVAKSWPRFWNDMERLGASVAKGTVI